MIFLKGHTHTPKNALILTYDPTCFKPTFLPKYCYDSVLIFGERVLFQGDNNKNIMRIKVYTDLLPLASNALL